MAAVSTINNPGRVCLLRWLMSYGRQICVCSLSLSPVWAFRHVGQRKRPDTQLLCLLISLLSDQHFLSAHLPLSQSLTLALSLSYLFPVLGHPINHSHPLLQIPSRPWRSLRVCTVPGWECLKVPLSFWERERCEFPLRCDNMMTVTLFSGTPHSLFCFSQHP